MKTNLKVLTFGIVSGLVWSAAPGVLGGLFWTTKETASAVVMSGVLTGVLTSFTLRTILARCGTPAAILVGALSFHPLKTPTKGAASGLAHAGRAALAPCPTVRRLDTARAPALDWPVWEEVAGVRPQRGASWRLDRRPAARFNSLPNAFVSKSPGFLCLDAQRRPRIFQPGSRKQETTTVSASSKRTTPESSFGAQRVYMIRPAIFAPSILSIVTVVAAFQVSWWSLAALPFIWLGSVCAQPNLNLANGCLAYLTMLIGFALTGLYRPLGLAILGGAMSGFYVSAIEKRIRACPAPAAAHSELPSGQQPDREAFIAYWKGYRTFSWRMPLCYGIYLGGLELYVLVVRRIDAEGRFLLPSILLAVLYLIFVPYLYIRSVHKRFARFIRCPHCGDWFGQDSSGAYFGPNPKFQIIIQTGKCCKCGKQILAS